MIEGNLWKEGLASEKMRLEKSWMKRAAGKQKTVRSQRKTFNYLRAHRQVFFV